MVRFEPKSRFRPLLITVLRFNLDRVSIAARSRSTWFANAGTAAPATATTSVAPLTTTTQPLAPRRVVGLRFLSTLFVVSHRADATTRIAIASQGPRAPGQSAGVAQLRPQG
jgi:hypothetical protein